MPALQELRPKDDAHGEKGWTLKSKTGTVIEVLIAGSSPAVMVQPLCPHCTYARIGCTHIASHPTPFVCCARAISRSRCIHRIRRTYAISRSLAFIVSIASVAFIVSVVAVRCRKSTGMHIEKRTRINLMRDGSCETTWAKVKSDYNYVA
jgi:hypothetical protein